MEDGFLVDSVRVFRVIDQVHFVLLLVGVSAYQEFMIDCVCHHRTHTSRLYPYIIKSFNVDIVGNIEELIGNTYEKILGQRVNISSASHHFKFTNL